MKTIYAKFLKVLIATLALLSLTNCSTYYEFRGWTEITGVDFARFSQQGFFFTTESYKGEYEPCGLIRAEIVPSIKKLKNIPSGEEEKYKKIADDMGNVYYLEDIRVEDVLEKIMLEAKKLNANGLMNLDIQTTEHIMTNITKVKGISVNGFAIKRIINK